MNITFTGGSTGGHVFPIRSLIQYIKSQPEIKSHFDTIYWFGENNSMEQRICTELINTYDHIKFETVISGKIRREHDLRALLLNIIDIFLFLSWIIVMVVRFPSYHIDIVFCKWGFVSIPLTIAAYIWRVPIYVHESDTSAGLATRICSRLATHNFSGFAGTLPNSQVIGQIMSSDLAVDQPYQYGDASKTNLLIMGWSLGAKVIYEAIIGLASEWVNEWMSKKKNTLENSKTHILENYNIIIILGALNVDMKPQFEWRTHVIDRADQVTMWKLYAWADVCVCRGGTTSLAEMELFAIRKIIVPLPITHDQVNNAQYYVDHHSDTMVMQNKHLSQNLWLQLKKSIWHHKPKVDFISLASKLNLAKEKIIEKIITLSC